MEKVRFNNSKSPEFISETKRRVADYFEKHNISIKSNSIMYLKSTLFILSAIIAYIILLISGDTILRVLILNCILGFLLAMFGFNIAHDAAHNAYSNHSTINRALSYFFDITSFSSYVWKVTHNILHHTYTNIPNVDNDITNFPIFRYSQDEKYCQHHSFQHLYASVVYALIGLNRLLFLDYHFFYTQRKAGKSIWKPFSISVFFKALHIVLFLVLPIVFLPLPWWQMVLCYFATTCIGSFTVAMVVSLAHVNDQVTMLDVHEDASLIDMHWAIHEMRTTCNFGTENKLVSFLVGGLNFQIEHHLFPQVCHVHYPKIAPIVKQTALEFGVPYHSIPTFTGAVKSHFRFLKMHSKKATKFAEEPCSP